MHFFKVKIWGFRILYSDNYLPLEPESMITLVIKMPLFSNSKYTASTKMVRSY